MPETVTPTAPTEWIMLANGNPLFLDDPNPEALTVGVIAEGLAKECRFAGQMPGFYSVAQHSVMVCDRLPIEWRGYGLLHDAPEGLGLRDLPAPVKRFLRSQSTAYDGLNDKIQAAVHAMAGLDWPTPKVASLLIKEADLKARATELRDLFYPTPDYAKGLPAPYPQVIKPKAWDQALDEFMDRAQAYLPRLQTPSDFF